MKKEISWIESLFNDERGSSSMKRVIALMCAIALCGVAYIGIFIKSAAIPPDYVVEAIVGVIVVCVGATSVDKFSFKGLPFLDKQPNKLPSDEK